MSPTLVQLQALAAVVDHQNFEQAAQSLHISISALSQRIAGLERVAGYPVVTRGRPAQVTEPGQSLLKLARQIDWLVSEHQREAADIAELRPSTMALAVNADSLSTWFKPMLRWFARNEVLLHLRIEDQDRTARLLERAEVVGAVSTRAAPPPGCRTTPLGRMRYLPTCAPELLPLEGLSEKDLPAWLQATPTLRFDTGDALPAQFAMHFGLSPGSLRSHLIPSNREYLDAVRAGLGWSVLPEDQVAGDLRDGQLVLLPTRHSIDVPLYWHRWRHNSALMENIDAEVGRCAERLRAPTVADGLAESPALNPGRAQHRVER
ncbi:LysR family transcriptional regulator (chromosome initiation inhibitor) [Nocardioides daedukensis]|uniref:LysR family transcriptional regulator (Chromosome initiation inhibitor) n=1 Tax=Nocardioides daedukensis TaxID=634462 RepID=A0A7Y9RZ37_9ACTN|nr:ArgP/LysG family DNA-binding transcriptional regulator [Nocardioides daedukensis]NYG59317.1 LysR family transcriptional regulator (chromosome initiation inhibitor) [Nocardioides daedukensis]